MRLFIRYIMNIYLKKNRANLYNAYYNSASNDLKASLDMMSDEQRSIAVEGNASL